MPTWREIGRSARLLFFRRSVDREVEEELRYHVDMRAQELRAAGVSAANALRRAETEMGGTARLKQDLRDVHGLVFASGLETVATDLRLALRRTRRAPGFVATIVLSVAIAIGANAAIYSAVRGLIDGPLPVKDVDRLVWMSSSGQDGGQSGALLDWEAQAASQRRDVFERVAVMGDRSLVRQAGARRSRWHGLWVTPHLAAVLQVRPVMGRSFTMADVSAGAPVMMISHERWVTDLGSDSTAVGRILSFVDNKSFLVIGVLPPRLEFPFGRTPRAGNGAGYRTGVQDFWFLGQLGGEMPGGTSIARLADGVSRERATAVIQTIGARPPVSGDSTRVITLTGVRDQALGIAGPGLRLAQAFAVIMLLLAAANLANLILLRLRSRATEFAVIGTLGGSRGAIVRMTVIEVTLLVAAGATVGLAGATYAPQLFLLLSADAMPMTERIRVDWGVAGYSVGASLVVAIAAGLLPAFLASRQSVASAISIGSRSATSDGRMRRFRAALVVAQVALAFVLAIGAALITTGFSRLAGVDTGYDPRDVLAADVEVFDHPDVAAYYRELDRQLRAIPGVDAVGLIHSTPLTGKWSFTSPFEIPGRTDPHRIPQVAGSFVAFDYFGAMRIPIIAGRSFTEVEFVGGRSKVIMINESAAKRFFPRESPIDRLVILNDAPRRIVGVVKDSRDVRLDLPAEPLWYEPVFGHGNQLMVRGSRPVDELLPEVRRVLVASDPKLVIERIGPFEEIVSGTLAERRLAMRLVTILATLSTALCVVGLYGLLAFAVRQRRREFGVRSALGAPRRALVGSIVRDGVRLAMAGLAIGTVAALAGTRVLSGLLYDVAPTDPATFLTVGSIFVLTAAGASLVPGMAAMRVDPSIALRDE